MASLPLFINRKLLLWESGSSSCGLGDNPLRKEEVWGVRGRDRRSSGGLQRDPRVVGRGPVRPSLWGPRLEGERGHLLGGEGLGDWG